MFALYITVAILLWLTLFCLIAWMHGQGEMGGDDAFPYIFAATLVSGLWPVLLGVGLAVLPFVGLYKLVKHISEKRG